MSTLKGKQDNLHAVQDKVAKLEAQLNEAMSEKQSLADQAALCEARLGRAGKLTDALGSEQIAWTEMVGVLGTQIDMLTGDVFLGAACVAYYGPFTGVFRNEIVEEWVQECGKVKMQVSNPFSLVNTLAKPVEVREWNLNGLPSDAVSIDNAVCVKIGLIMALLVNNNKHVLGVGNTGLSRCLYLRVHSIGVQVLPMCIPTVFTCVE